MIPRAELENRNVRLSTTMHTRQQASNAFGEHDSEDFLEWTREFRDSLGLEE